jgi:TolA-binding protein
MKSRTTILFSLAVIVLVPVLSSAQVGVNTEALLKQILQNQQEMRAELDAMKKQMADRDQEISELRSLIQQQQTTIEEQAKVVQTAAAMPAGPMPTDRFSARLQYDAARQLMHDVIFDVRKGEQKPWFERVIVEFRKVVEQYPDAPEAQESQLRIARIYGRYLDDQSQARKEYQFLIDKYPNGPHVEEAKKNMR